MSLFKRLFYRFFRPNQAPHTQVFSLDAHLEATLRDLAAEQRRPVNEIANALIQQALDQRGQSDANLQTWSSLSPRQQEIAALICVDYTNQQIAARLQISPETVKSHVRSVLSHFAVNSKSELRRRLAGWDFSAWR